MLTQSKRRCEGFSLLEIMIVVFLIAMLATITTYKIGNSNSSVIESEARQLVDKLNLIMDESILTGFTHDLIIEKKGDQYGYYFRKEGEQIEEQPYKLKLLKEGLAIEFDLINNSGESGLGIVDLELFDNTLQVNRNQSSLLINVDGTFPDFTIRVLEYDNNTGKSIQDVPHWLVSGDARNNTISVEQMFDE